MTKLIGYHYSNEDYEIGQVVALSPRELDLSEDQAVAEHVIRQAHPEGEERGQFLRSGALYLWEDERRAERLWVHRWDTSKPKRYFYSMEYDAEDVLHKGDLSHYTELTDNKGQDDLNSASLYWQGKPHSTDNPLIEILVTKAKVIGRKGYL